MLASVERLASEEGLASVERLASEEGLASGVHVLFSLYFLYKLTYTYI